MLFWTYLRCRDLNTGFSADTFWAHLRMRGVEIGARHAEGFHARKLKGTVR